MTKKTSGYIELKDGYRFFWMLGAGHPAEVFGGVEKPGTGIIASTSGWYRTGNPEEAAEIAQQKMATAPVKASVANS